jgi:glutathione S-transferase
MIKLYRSGRFETLGDASPFIYKLETYLRMAGVPFEAEVLPVNTLLQSAPRKLIPYIDDEGHRIGDSSLIIAYLQDKYDDPLRDRALSHDQEMLGTLIKTLCEHELFYIMIYGRWLDGDYLSFSRFLARQEPEERQARAAELSLEFVKGLLNGFRIGRYDSEFVQNALQKKLEVLSHFLGDQPWILGNAPSMFDAGLYGILASFIHFPLPNKHVEIARGYENLVAYCDRIKATVYDQESWIHGA